MEKNIYKKKLPYENVLITLFVVIVIGVGASLFFTSKEIYYLISNRGIVLSDLGKSFGLISNDFLLLKPSDVLSVSDGSILFLNTEGNVLSYRKTQKGHSSHLWRNQEQILNDVISFDMNEKKIDASSPFKRIKYEVFESIPEKGGMLRLRTEVFPRSYMYEQFQEG